MKNAQILRQGKPINHSKLQMVDEVSEAPATQDENPIDVPSCAQCRQVFNIPWKQRHHICPGSAESSIILDKPVPAAVTCEPAEVPERSMRTRSSTISQMDNTTEDDSDDLPKCEKCGKIFTWDQVQLFWQHRCQDHPQRQNQDGQPISMEYNSKSEANSAPCACKCGKKFPGYQRREFVLHKLACVRGTPSQNTVCDNITLTFRSVPFLRKGRTVLRIVRSVPFRFYARVKPSYGSSVRFIPFLRKGQTVLRIVRFVFLSYYNPFR